MKIKNFFQYGNKKSNGLLEVKILNDIRQFEYDIKNNLLSIKSKDDVFEGNIDLKPFSLIKVIEKI